jgi:hypothetical protein
MKLIRESDLVLFVPSQLERKIEPLKVCALGECLRLSIVKRDEVPSSFKEQIRKGLLL